MKEAKAQEDVTKVATNDVDHELDHLEGGYSENGHELEETVVSEGTTDLHDEVRDHVDEVPVVVVQGVGEEVVESIAEVLPHPEAMHAEVHVDEIAVDDVPQVSESEVEDPLSHGDIDSNGLVESQELTPATEKTVHSTVSGILAIEDDIEDMVVMLESVTLSKHRPQSIVSIPDDHGEIPDED